MQAEEWQTLLEDISRCERCALCRQASRRVPGQGDRQSPLVLLGEGPGQREDEEGYAFVGPAGQLLTKLLVEIGLPRDRVYICNVVKCRPPGNRVPLPEEAAACHPLLERQLSLIQPQVMLLLGSTAARHMLGNEIRITRDRGQWFRFRDTWLLPTYHPSALLRDASLMADAKKDFSSLRDRLWQLGLYRDLQAYRS